MVLAIPEKVVLIDHSYVCLPVCEPCHQAMTVQMDTTWQCLVINGGPNGHYVAMLSDQWWSKGTQRGNA